MSGKGAIRRLGRRPPTNTSLRKDKLKEKFGESENFHALITQIRRRMIDVVVSMS